MAEEDKKVEDTKPVTREFKPEQGIAIRETYDAKYYCQKCGNHKGYCTCD